MYAHTAYACPVDTEDKRLLDFAESGLLMKLFQAGSSNIVQECRSMFSVQTVTDLILNRKQKFLIRLVDCCDNVAVSGWLRQLTAF